MKIKKLPAKDFKNIYSRVPRLCVDLVIETKDGIILTKRETEPCIGQWHIPGGTVLKGEKLSDTIKRIAQEELGIDVKIDKLIGVIEYSIKNYFSHPVGIAYLVKAIAGQKIKLNKDKCNVFNVIPKNTIRDQKEFLSATLNLKTEK